MCMYEADRPSDRKRGFYGVCARLPWYEKTIQLKTFWQCSSLHEFLDITSKACCVVNFIARKVLV